MTAKTHVPQQGAFQSDPAEQIALRQTLGGSTPGLDYMFLNAAQQRGDARTAEYMQGVQEANKLAAALSQQDSMMELLKESLKQAPEYAKAGLPISDVSMLSRLFASGGTGQAAEASSLVNELKKAMVAEHLAKATASGRESLPETTIESQGTPSGISIETVRTKQKGGDPAALQERQRRLMVQLMKNRGIIGSGPGETGLPNANARDVSQTQEYNRGRFGN